MELKVFKDTIASYGGRWETRLELPVETEILIPDYLPAVFKIVKCLIAPVVLQNRVAGGRWQVEGYLRCTVFYQSEEPGTRLLRTEQKFAFEKSVELPAGQYAEGPAQVWGEPEYCNCRAVSEHRIDLRGAYILCAAVAVRKELELLTSLADCGIEQYTRTMQGLQCAVTEEKTLTAETVAALPGAGESVLDITGSFAPGGVTLATGQASVQGTLQIQICSQNADSGELTVRSKELPIQQNLELPGAAEDDTALVRGEVLACTLSADDGAGEAALTVTWKLRIEVWRSVQYSVVADAYSTLCKTQTVQTVCRLLQQTTVLAGRIPISIEDDLPDAGGTVLGCFVTLGALCAAPAEGDKAETHLRLSGKGTAHVFISDARGELTCYDKTFSWQPGDLWSGVADAAWPSVGASVVRVSSSKNGARLRVDLEIEVNGALLQAQSFDALCGVELGEAYDDSDGPALYIYYAQQGERIFDIAKRYHARAHDELPQSAAGRTIMTTEPKFIPEKAVKIDLSGGGSFKARLIDCVGYMVDGALGHEENEAPRLVKSPWFDHEVPFDLAAETGTRCVIREHATIGLVVTTDGSVADLPREAYLDAERRIIAELNDSGKPYVILLNCAEPDSDDARRLATELAERYAHAVVPLNCTTMTVETLDSLLQTLLYEFPIREIAVRMPGWVTMLESGHWLQSAIYTAMLEFAASVHKMADLAGRRPQLGCEYITSASLTGMDLASGSVGINAVVAPDIFYKILGEQTGLDIVDEASLLPCVVSLARAKRAYDKIKSALDQVEATGYGIVMPGIDELTLEEPEIVRQGGQYGVRLSASAPSLHIIRANIHTELSPTVGSEQQGEELIKSLLSDFETAPGKLWSTNILGKSLNELVSEGVQAKLLHMPQEARARLQQTLERIINEGCDGLICILL